MIFTRFLSHPHQVLPHNFLRSRELEIGCRFWTAKVVLLKTILIYFYLSLSFQLRIRPPWSGDPHDARMEMELWVSKTAAALGGSTEPERKAIRVSGQKCVNDNTGKGPFKKYFLGESTVTLFCFFLMKYGASPIFSWTYVLRNVQITGADGESF